jgi:dTMP kinase
MSTRDMRYSRRGKLIVLEGGDGTGTTTQAQLLFEYLLKEQEWTRPILTAEPSAHPIGTFIRELLTGHAEHLSPAEMALLFFADRGEHYRNVISPALNSGNWVVCDRNWQSTLVYQALIQDDKYRMVSLVMQLVNLLNLDSIDKCFILDVPFEIVQERVAKRKSKLEVYETARIQRRVLAAYREILCYDRSAVLIRCEQKTPIEIHNIIIDCLQPDLQQ